MAEETYKKIDINVAIAIYYGAPLFLAVIALFFHWTISCFFVIVVLYRLYKALTSTDFYHPWEIEGFELDPTKDVLVVTYEDACGPDFFDEIKPILSIADHNKWVNLVLIPFIGEDLKNEIRQSAIRGFAISVDSVNDDGTFEVYLMKYLDGSCPVYVYSFSNWRNLSEEDALNKGDEIIAILEEKFQEQ